MALTPIPYDQPPFAIPDETPITVRLQVLELTARDASVREDFQYIAREIKRAVVPNATWQQIAAVALALVHKLPYLFDKDYRDTWQGVKWTLKYGGDCEDLAVVLMAIYLALGIRASLIWINFDAPYNHVTVKVGPTRETELYAESIVKTARLGQSPYELQNEVINPSGIIPVNVTNSVTPNWSSWRDPVGREDIPTDFQLAHAWLNWLVEFTTTEQMQAINELSFAEQRSYTKAAWDALANVYTTVNLHPLLDPVWIETMAQTYGGARATFNDRGQRQIITWPLSVVGSRINALWQRLGRNPQDINAHSPMAVIRESLQSLQTSVMRKSTCDGNPFDPAADGYCDWRKSFGVYAGWMEETEARDGEGNPAATYHWGVVGWKDPPNTTSPVASAWSFLPPLRWSFELVGKIANAIKRQGLLEWRQGASAYCLLWNVSGARRVGLLEGDDFAKMRETIAAWVPPISAEEYGNRDNVRASNAIASLAGMAMAAPPPVGPIAGAVLGIAAFIARILPGAVGNLGPSHTPDGKPIWYDSSGDASTTTTLSAGTTTLSADLQTGNLVIPAGATLNPNGFVVYVNGTLTIAVGGAIAQPGQAAAAEVAGASTPTVLSSGSIMAGGMAGGVGAIAATPPGAGTSIGVKYVSSVGAVAGGNGGAGVVE